MSDQPILGPTPQGSSQSGEELFGHSSAELQSMGMGALLQPPIPEPETYKPLSTGSRADPNEPLESLEDPPQPSTPEYDLAKFRDPSQLWGYSPKDLKRLDMGSLIPPNRSSSRGGSRVSGVPPVGRTAPKRENPKMEIIDPQPQQVIEPPKRGRGAPKGNLNALKHGLYIEGARIRNTTPLERAELFDIYNIINYIKDYIEHTYESGILCKDMADINETMRSLSLAGMSLTRLIAMHDQHVSTPLPSNIPVTEHTNILKIVEHYKKKLAPIVDLSDLDLRGIESE